MRSFANLLKSSLGSGILAMPAAFKNAGTVVGIVGTIILGYICTHCVYLLVNYLDTYFIAINILYRQLYKTDGQEYLPILDY